VFVEKILQRARRFAIVGVILAAVGYLASGLLIVRWNEVAIVKRFGKPVIQAQPGLHYRLPRPLETVDRVAVADVRIEKIPSSLMLTGDENLIEIEAVTHYKVKDAAAFIYNLSEPEDLVRNVVEAALRSQINLHPIDFILTVGKGEIQLRAEEIAQSVLDQQQSGVQLLIVQLTKDTPPGGVMEAFRDVASAREDKNTYINEALAYQSEVVPKSRGEAQKQIEEALAYKERKIRTARGDSQRFLSKLREYQKSRDITEKRLYIEALERSLPNVNKLILNEKVQVGETGLWFLKGDVGDKFIEEVRKP
jgi:membrane protease subunit HflK